MASEEEKKLREKIQANSEQLIHTVQNLAHEISPTTQIENLKQKSVDKLTNSTNWIKTQAGSVILKTVETSQQAIAGDKQAIKKLAVYAGVGLTVLSFLCRSKKD